MSTSRRNLDNTTATLPIVTTRGNQKPVEDFISYIRERVGTATRNWREIAQAFAEAKEMYGADSDAFKRLCKATKFSRSTADRLAKIAASARLKKHETELAAVHSWSTLYAIMNLPEYDVSLGWLIMRPFFLPRQAPYFHLREPSRSSWG